MSEPRIKSELWVQYAVRTAGAAGRAAAVLRRGDSDAGGLIFLLRGREGFVILTQARNGEGNLGFVRASGETPISEEAAEAYVARQIRFDPDLWVVELEAPDGKLPFPARIF